MSDAHKRKRFEFASENQKWTSEMWKKVIWIDESTFGMEKTLRHFIVLQKSNERYKLDYLKSTFKLGHTFVTVWKVFTTIHKLPLIAMPSSR